MRGLLDIGTDPTEAQRQFLIQQAMLGAAAGLLQAGQPSRIPTSTGAAIGQGLLGGAAGMQQGHQLLAATEKAKLDRMKVGMDMQSAAMNQQKTAMEVQKELEQVNARRALAGMPPISAPAAPTLGAMMMQGQPAAPVMPGIAQAAPPSAAAPMPAIAGVRPEVLRGEAPPTAVEAMKLSTLYSMAGDTAGSNAMRDYAYGGVGGFRFGGDWNAQAPITGGAQDPTTKLVQGQADRGLVRNADGSFGYAPGIVRSEAGKAGAVSGAQQQAQANVDLVMKPRIETATVTARETAQKPFTQGKEARETELKLFDDFSGQQTVKDYKQSVGFYNAISDAYVSDNTKAGDLLMIVQTAKLLDPSSVAREGEVETVRGTGPVGSQLTGMFNFIQGGGRLSDTQKRELLTMARTKVGSLHEVYEAEVRTTRDRATRYGVDARNVTGELPQLRTVEDSIMRSITSGKLDPAKAPGAMFDKQRGGWVIPGIAGIFKEKK
jgi:hypothetical protein